MNCFVKGIAQTFAAGLTCLAVAQDVPVEKYRLGNGMTVILREDHTVPLATVNIWFRVGSKDEPPRHSGFAHLFEHLMFMGTNRVPTGQFDQIMEGGGGDNNASTAEDRTNFYDSGPSNLLPTLIWLEADRLQDLGRAMTLKKLNLQRDVVKNERRQNTENTPYGSAYEAVNGLMFPVGHPYHTSVIGSMSDLDNASVKDVQSFFATYYVPNNASMVIAGDFQKPATKGLIQKLFGTLPQRSEVPRKPVPSLPPLGVKRVTLTDKVAASKLIMTWHSPAAYKPGDTEIQLVASVLGDGVNGRLYQRLVVKDKLATAVSVFQEQRLLGSVFYVDVTAATGADLKKLQVSIDQELALFCKKGPTQIELQRQSAKIESGTLNSLQSIGNVADSLNTYEYYIGQPNSFKAVLDSFRRAAPEQVRRVAAKTLDLNDRVIITVVPRSETKEPKVSMFLDRSTGAAAQKFATTKPFDPRDVRPSLGKPKAFSAPSPEVFKLSNGMPVYYWRRSELPLMSVNLQFRSGAEGDPEAKAGLSELTAGLLTEGAGNRNSVAYQNALDTLGADLGASVSQSRIAVTLNVLARNFQPALDLYADAVIRPKLADSEFERVKRVTEANLQQERDEVSVVASKVAMREFFGSSYSFGRPISGTPTTVDSLTLSDVKAEHAREYESQNGAFYVAGSLDIKLVRTALEKEFGSWKSVILGQVTSNEVPLAQSDALRLFIVDKPGAVQTAIQFLMPAPTYSSPDRLPLQELGTLLGGSFTSRLNQNLREDKGYTYGASARFGLDRNVGTLVAGASVRADVTGASLKEFFKEFDRIRTGDITSEEVAKATATIRTDQIGAVSTLTGLLSKAVSLAEFGRPITALSKDQIALGNITATQLNRLAKSSVPYEKGVLVLVGDKAAIFKQLAEFNLPEPKIVEPN